jgi:hypothetical protein
MTRDSTSVQSGQKTAGENVSKQRSLPCKKHNTAMLTEYGSPITAGTFSSEGSQKDMTNQ